MKQEPTIIVCLMCVRRDKPRSDCSMCRGTGGLEARFKKGMMENEMELLGKIGKSGYPKVWLPLKAKGTN